MLDYYSTQLSSVEVNYTFRRFPSEKTVEKWRAKAADGFVFTLKANQRITHWKKLEDVEEDVRDFVAAGASSSATDSAASCSSARRRCATTRALLDSFLATLPAKRTRLRDGIPPRIMVGRARTVARRRRRDGASPRPTRRTPRRRIFPGSPSATSGCARRSTATRNSPSGPSRIQPALDAGATIFCYFKHEDEGASPKMAKRLEAMLEVPLAGGDAAARGRQGSARSRPRRTPPRHGGRTQYFTATSIDGFIADADNSLDWLFQATRRGRDTVRHAGASSATSARWRWGRRPTSGRSSTRSCWRSPPSGTSGTATSPAGSSPIASSPRSPGADIRFVQGDVDTVHKAMTAAADGKNIWIVGGGELVGQFADERPSRRNPAPRRAGDARRGRAAAPPSDHGPSPHAAKRRNRGWLRLPHVRGRSRCIRRQLIPSSCPHRRRQSGPRVDRAPTGREHASKRCAPHRHT